MLRRKKIDTNTTYHSEWKAFLTFGNMSALAVIYEDNFDLLFNYGRKFTREGSVIEDSIQNLFTNLIRSREKLGKLNNVKQYLMAAHRNELIELLSKKKNTLPSEILHDTLFKPEYSVEEEIIEQEDRVRLRNFLKKSLEKLTAHQQEAIYLKYDVGLSYEEISKVLNISVESCRTSIYRSIKIIKSEVEILNQKKIQLFFSILRAII
ncbi:MAG: sigma-70 family RNA polymerase sigma factor [Mariniphaga sp.]